MAFLHRSIFLTIMMAAFVATMPGQAQTSATLNVTVRVVEECVISAALKRRIARLARKTGRTDILQTCSKGVVSKVNERMVNQTVLQPTAPLPSAINTARIAKKTSAGRSDVVLVTVSY